VITTVAGNGIAGFAGDGGQATAAELGDDLVGVAVDSAGTFFIPDYGNNRIREVTVSTGVITTVAGNGTLGYRRRWRPATTAELEHPTGVAFDSAGDLLIAGFWDNRIREVNQPHGRDHQPSRQWNRGLQRRWRGSYSGATGLPRICRCRRDRRPLHLRSVQ